MWNAWMCRRIIVAAFAAAVAVSCSSETTSLTADMPARVTAAPTTQNELEQLRAENAALREQLGLARREASINRDRANEITAKNTSIERGELRPGMTVHEAHKAVTGSATLRRDTCQLVEQKANEWVYHFRPESAVAGPGSGGASAVGTNMRGAVAVVPASWECIFDGQTGLLKSFRRIIP